MIPDVSANRTLRIGALASQTGVSVEALRYYETRGLLRPASRRATGYREYAADSVRLVRFIKRAQALGFSLAEVEELVRLRERAWAGDAPGLLRAAAVAKVADIDRRLRELGALRGALAELVSACDAVCPVEPPTSPDARTACGEPSTRATTPLPCPLIEAFDADVDEPERSRPLVTSSPPAPRRRPKTSRRTPGRDTPLTQRRNP